MPVKIRTAQELAQLTPAEKRAAGQLVAGASNAEAAQALGISTTTFTGHIVAISKKFGITSRSARPARAHAVLASGQVPPPPAPERIPDFTERDLRLLRALAEHPETRDIAMAVEIAPADVRRPRRQGRGRQRHAPDRPRPRLGAPRHRPPAGRHHAVPRREPVAAGRGAYDGGIVPGDNAKVSVGTLCGPHAGRSIDGAMTSCNAISWMNWTSAHSRWDTRPAASRSFCPTAT